MSELKYSRPSKMKKALKLIETGDPLAGGTSITPRRGSYTRLVDIQDLGLDSIEVNDEFIKVGAGAKLQKFLEEIGEYSEPLAKACRLEAGLNIRLMSSLGGTIVEADGRSPFLTALLAMDTTVILEPGAKNLPLEKLLKNRKKRIADRLITEIVLRIPEKMAFEYVARSPADRPLVCSAAALYREGTNQSIFISLGGFGAVPIRIAKSEKEIMDRGNLEAATRIASQMYAEAEDWFASGEYRSHVSGVLVKRVLEEVLS